ncbi:unnamed protein product [Cuscuta campestris]|uniref:Uncharacterized protein n=1 Tax=Cuscuta campestris TaxID=132261 RepID=A0A484NLV6_9ASTE|nr:unnamed protein product [Cuscuta campestris]
MVGIFSRFSVSKNGHRRAQSALDVRDALPSKPEATIATSIVGAAAAVCTHGIEVAVGFKPVEHPFEPFDNDAPIRCPLPEPSILNDGRIWEERVLGARKPSDLEVVHEGVAVGPEAASTTTRQHPSARPIFPSISAPEHSIIGLLEES